MILKIEQSKYYGYQGKTKELFKKKYRRLHLKWMTDVNIDGTLSDGWISDDKSQYLLKLPEEGEFKRFTGNSIGMIEFLKLQGAIEVEGEESGIHIDYNDQKGFKTMEDRFGRFVGFDLYSHFRVEEILKGMPENWNIKWSNKSISIEIQPEMNEIAKSNVVKVLEIMQPKKKIVRLIRRIKINGT